MGGNEYSALFATAKETGGNFGTCTKCERNSAASEAGLCRTCAYVSKYDPTKVTLSQVAKTIQQLRSSTGTIRWPYGQLDTVAGPIPLGSVVYVVAGTGIGKTTFSVDLVRRWVTGEPFDNPTNLKERKVLPIGVTVLPLETSPEDWRQAFAANMVGVNHGDVFEMVASFHDGDASVKPTLDLVEQAAFAQGADENLRHNLHIIDDETVTVDNLGKAFALAKAAGHQVVVIDHIDQVGDDEDPLTGRKARGMEAVEKINNAVLRYARAYKMVAICMSQANMSVQGDGTNPLLRFRKLELKHVMWSSFKIKNAAQILGIYRPLKLGVTRHDFALAREGVIDPMEVLADNRMGVNAMKLRHRGKNEQRTVDLVYEHGRVRDLTAQEVEQDRILRLTSDALSHQTFAVRDSKKSLEPGIPSKFTKKEPPTSYVDREPPTLDM